LFVIGVALLSLGRYSDALISVGLGLINALISATQEIRAKRKLDRLQLLNRRPVLVLRDGRAVEITPEVVVRGDVLRVRAGDQIVVDGPLLDGEVEADESLLTGESEPVVKHVDDDLRSGSLCVAGGGRQLARDIGAASYAGRLTAQARRASTDTTPLQRRIAFVVRLVMALTALMSAAILAQAALEGFTLLRVVQTRYRLSPCRTRSPSPLRSSRPRRCNGASRTARPAPPRSASTRPSAPAQRQTSPMWSRPCPRSGASPPRTAM
jgi:cation-transporting P-type ATPase E